MREIQNDRLKEQFITTTHFREQFGFPVDDQTKLLFFPAREALVRANRESPYLLYLVRGRTKLSHGLANGKTIITGFFDPPCFIGEMELLDPTSPAFDVQAIQDCWCLALEKAQVADRLLTDATFLRRICVYLTRKDVANITVAARNEGFTATQRLAAFILQTANAGWYREQHTQVAQYLGISYRHLLYVLADLVQRHILEKTATGYRICDPAALQRLTQES